MRKVRPAAVLPLDVRVAVFVLFLFSSLSFSQYNSAYPLSCSMEVGNNFPNGTAVSAFYTFDHNSGLAVLFCGSYNGVETRDSSRFVLPKDCEYKGVTNASGVCCGAGYCDSDTFSKYFNCHVGFTLMESYHTASVHASLSFNYSCPFPPPCDSPATAADSLACGISQGGPEYCATTQTTADILRNALSAKCDSLGGSFTGGVYQRAGSCGQTEYCVSDACESGQEEDEPCPDGTDNGSFLQKKSVSGSGSERFSSDGSSADYWNKTDYTRGKPALLYDALGRRTEPHPETRRRLFQWKHENNVFDKDRDFVLMEGNLFRLIYGSDTCGIKGVDYGIIKDGKLQGGYYCHFLKMDVHKDEYNWSRIADSDSLCRNDKLINATLEYRYKPVIAKDSIYYVKEGYVFPDTDYVTKPQDEIYFKKHEERHRRDARKIISAEAEKKVSINKTMCKSEFCAWKVTVKDSLSNEAEKELNLYNAKIDSAKEYYHDQCYIYGNC